LIGDKFLKEYSNNNIILNWILNNKKLFFICQLFLLIISYYIIGFLLSILIISTYIIKIVACIVFIINYQINVNAINNLNQNNNSLEILILSVYASYSDNLNFFRILIVLM
jgi:hypothetical protein